MSQLLKDTNRQAELAERRRDQATADDRYLARKRWTQMRDEALAERGGK